jgi:8-oxo-dGTP diphosphatase
LTSEPLPTSPVVGVGAVVLHEGRVLLVRRGKQPLLGRWVVPGGRLELGETLEAAVAREVAEETGVRVAPIAVVDVFDRIDLEEGRVRFHYVIVDYACRYLGGLPRAASDAADVAWVAQEKLAEYDLPAKALELIQRCFEREPDLAAGPGPR